MLDFAKDKAFWERVRTSDDFKWHREEIKQLYDEAFKVEPRAHSAEDILENNDHGLWRLQFDHLQSSALMSLIYPENEEYYKNLLKIVWAYLNEYTWAPLGHYTEYYYQRTPKDFDYGLLDIFACSASLALAEIKNLFKERFPKLLTDRITYEIRRRTIEPYLSREFFWEKHDNNWTAVCTGAVGSVLMYEAPELYYENKERLHKSMWCYLDSYKDDGMCVEGVGYWGFGFGFFTTYALLEREFTNGEVDWFKIPKVKEIGKYLQKMFLTKDVIVTYGDCSVTQNYAIGLPAMLRYVYGDEIERLPKDLAIVAKDNTHFNFLLRAVLYYDKDNFTNQMSNNITYTVDDSAYFVKRTRGFGFSCKGGNNGESHNHIDVGNFILARNDKQIIADIGAGPYLEGYHGDKRYTYFHPSVYAHNLPIIDGVPEDQYRREDVIVSYDYEKSTASMDVNKAYTIDYMQGFDRSFVFDDYEITLKDSFKFSKEAQVTERFIALIEPKALGNIVLIDDVALIEKNNIIPKITTKEVIAHMGNRAHNVYIIEYEMPMGTSEFEIKFKVQK